MSNFNKHKIYRVVEKRDYSGNVKFHVEASDSLIGAIFGDWIQYEHQSETLEKAKEFIRQLVSYKVARRRVVYKNKSNEMLSEIFMKGKI